MKALFEEFLHKLDGNLSVLPDKDEENAHNTLCALWHAAAGTQVSPITAVKLKLPFLEPLQVVMLEKLLQKRLAGTPLAHLTNRQHFMGLDYILKQGLYIPRRETELLSQTVIDLLLKDFATDNNINVIDVCTGIGTIAIAIAHYCKNAIVYGTDIYEPAIEAANINANHFGLNNKVTFYKGDMFDPIKSLDLMGKTDIIVSAPPYISTLKVKQIAKEISEYEPHEAFDAGPFGLSIFNKLISYSPDYLSKNGYLIFECGLGQGDFLSKRIQSNKAYGEINKVHDKYGNVRVLKIRMAG